MSDDTNELRELFRSLSRPLEPIPTDLAPNLSLLPDVRAVVFDVYGTMICSGVGDISLDEESDRDGLIRELLEKYDFPLKSDADTEVDLSQVFHGLIRQSHEASRNSGIDFPEVDILKIWEQLIEQFSDTPNVKLSLSSLKQLAIEYECRVNPVWPNPGLKEVLTTLNQRGIKLGIVSNAQFYTPIMLEAFLDAPLEEIGFDSRLLIWSFEEGAAKPSKILFPKLAERLTTHHNIAPEQMLYVGNDMLKDIWASSQAGFKTALFAGDQRSLRLRENDERCSNLKPDCVLKKMSDLVTAV